MDAASRHEVRCVPASRLEFLAQLKRHNRHELLATRHSAYEVNECPVSNVLIELLPLIAGAAIVPLWPMIVLFLLRSPGGLSKAVAFVAGAVTVRLLQGILFGLIFGAAEETYPDSPAIIASILLLVIGILLLITAFMKWRKEEDPDAPPPRWIAAISGLSTPRAYFAGALLVSVATKQWVFTLSAISVIEDAAVSRPEAVGLYLLFVLAAQALVVTPLVIYVAAPKRAGRWLESAHGWLERNNDTILIAASLIFGLYFAFKGVSGLLG